MKISNKNLISRSLINLTLPHIKEYESLKNKTSKCFKYAKDFYKQIGMSGQNFLKIYNRYKQNPDDFSLVLQKRGPKFMTRRTDIKIENRIVELRKLGNSRQEIVRILSSENIKISESTIYNIFKKYNLNKLNSVLKQNRRVQKMEEIKKLGELIHIDLHQFPKGITIADSHKTYYLVGLIDAFSGRSFGGQEGVERNVFGIEML